MIINPTFESGRSTTFRAIVNFDLNQFALLLLLRGQSVPPLLQGVNDEVTDFIGTAKGNVQLAGIFVDKQIGHPHR